MTNPNDVAQIKHLDSLLENFSERVPAPTANDTDKFLRGDGQWATPILSGGGSSIVVAGGTILDTVSSTVDGGLWFEVVDGLPIVKMNYNGSTFALGAKPTDGALIGDKFYLGGHEFKLTGFASGLTFSDNNFYVADTVVGSVSNFAFQFTNAAALSVAEGGTISITQLDTDVVDFSLDLGFLGVNPLPAPTVVIMAPFEAAPSGNALCQTLEVTDAATAWSGKISYCGSFGFVTDSTGNLNVTGMPDNVGVIIAKCTTCNAFLQDVGFNGDTTPAAVADVQNPAYWVVHTSIPNHSPSEFTCVFNATNTHSSVTVTVNITDIVND